MEAPEAEPLRPAALSAEPRPAASSCARLPRALAVAAAAAVAARASWSAMGWQEGRPAGDPVSASEERWTKKEDTVCTNFVDVQVGGSIVDSSMPACIFECQKNRKCVAMSHISGEDWDGKENVGAGACFLLSAGCQEAHSGQSHNWHLYERTFPEVVEVSHQSPTESPTESASTPSPTQSPIHLSSQTGVWEVWPKTGCGNWNVLRLGDVLITNNQEECQVKCADLTACHAFNHQPGACAGGEAQGACPRCAPGEPPAYKKGACILYGRGNQGEGCQQGRNACWDLFITSG